MLNFYIFRQTFFPCWNQLFLELLVSSSPPSVWLTVSYFSVLYEGDKNIFRKFRYIHTRLVQRPTLSAAGENSTGTFFVHSECVRNITMMAMKYLMMICRAVGSSIYSAPIWIDASFNYTLFSIMTISICLINNLIFEQNLAINKVTPMYTESTILRKYFKI